MGNSLTTQCVVLFLLLLCSFLRAPMGITAVTITPENPIPGQNVTVAFTGTPTQTVSAPTQLVFAVKVYGVKVGHDDFDFCGELGVQCPVAAGTSATWSATYPVPSVAPGGIACTAEVSVHKQD